MIWWMLWGWGSPPMAARVGPTRFASTAERRRACPVSGTAARRQASGTAQRDRVSPMHSTAAAD
jgi:hypothetical protein